MMFRSHTAAIYVATLAAALTVTVTTAQAEKSSTEREKETSGVTPDKATTSAGQAKQEGTGEGRQTPADRTPASKGGSQ